jgi:hypothetical protein
MSYFVSPFQLDTSSFSRESQPTAPSRKLHGKHEDNLPEKENTQQPVPTPKRNPQYITPRKKVRYLPR